MTVEDMLREGSLDGKALDALAPRAQEEPVELHPPTEHELMHRLNTMEFENTALKNKLRRLEEQVKLAQGRKMAMEEIEQIEDAYLRGGAMLLGGEEARLVGEADDDLAGWHAVPCGGRRCGYSSVAVAVLARTRARCLPRV